MECFYIVELLPLFKFYFKFYFIYTERTQAFFTYFKISLFTFCHVIGAPVTGGPWAPVWEPLTGLFYSYRGRQMLLSISLPRRTSFPVGSAPGLRIWILRVGRSTPTRLPASPAAARTLGCGLFTAETCRPLSSPYSSSNLSKPRLSLLSMAFRGVICIQQRNS